MVQPSDLDPFRLGFRAQPVPVDGELPPAMCLVDDEGPYPTGRPLWVRCAAAGIAATFVAFSTMTAAAVGGWWSPLTDAGNHERFDAAVGARHGTLPAP